MKKIIILIFLIGSVASNFGQQVDLITINQLNQRIQKSGGDTTFVINFWATWCIPCLKELPHFEKFQDEYKNLPVKVLLISVDFKSKLSRVTDYVNKEKLRSEVYLLNESDQQEYIDRIDENWSGTIPATLFIHKRNRKFHEGAFTYTSLLKEFKTIK